MIAQGKHREFYLECGNPVVTFVTTHWNLLTVGPDCNKHRRQCCNDASNTSLIGSNRATPGWGCNRFWSGSIVFNETCIASVVTALTLSVNGEPESYVDEYNCSSAVGKSQHCDDACDMPLIETNGIKQRH